MIDGEKASRFTMWIDEREEREGGGVLKRQVVFVGAIQHSLNLWYSPIVRRGQNSYLKHDVKLYGLLFA